MVVHTCYIRLLFIFASLFLIATVSSFPPFVSRIKLKRKNAYLATCVPPIRYAFAGFTERYRSCELRALWYYQKQQNRAYAILLFAI